MTHFVANFKVDLWQMEGITSPSHCIKISCAFFKLKYGSKVYL